MSAWTYVAVNISLSQETCSTFSIITIVTHNRPKYEIIHDFHISPRFTLQNLEKRENHLKVSGYRTTRKNYKTVKLGLILFFCFRLSVLNKFFHLSTWSYTNVRLEANLGFPPPTLLKVLIYTTNKKAIPFLGSPHVWQHWCLLQSHRLSCKDLIACRPGRQHSHIRQGSWEDRRGIEVSWSFILHTAPGVKYWEVATDFNTEVYLWLCYLPILFKEEMWYAQCKILVYS